jgi:hypothetical protein
VFDGHAGGATVTRRIAIVSAAVFLLTLGGWVAVNPGGEFGLSRFGVTTYSRVPVPFVDLQVRADGAFRPVFKSHNIDASRLEWLLANAAPDILIVAVGWEGAARLAEQFRPPKGTRLVVLPTSEALGAYNSLKAQGVRVAIHVHSTC